MIGNIVSIATDLCSGPSSHQTLGAIPPEIHDCEEPMNHPLGGILSRHSLASKVKHKGEGLVLDGHDLGPFLRHFPFNNPYFGIKSSRKVIYTASTVLAQAKAVACVDRTKGTKMMLCGDFVSMPNGENNSNAVHSVSVGMTDLDYFKGYVNIATSVATDIVSSGISVISRQEEAGLGDVIKDAAGIDVKKSGIATAAGLAGSVAVSYKSGWKEPIVLKCEVGGAFIGGSIDHQWNPSTGAVTSKPTVNVAGLKVEGSTDYSTIKAEGTAWGGEPVQETWGDSL